MLSQRLHLSLLKCCHFLQTALSLFRLLLEMRSELEQSQKGTAAVTSSPTLQLPAKRRVRWKTSFGASFSG